MTYDKQEMAEIAREIDEVLSELRVNDYVVGMIDSLGQADRLQGWARLPQSRAELERFADAFNETVGRVNSLRQEFRRTFEKLMRDEDRKATDSPFSPEQQRLYNRATGFDVGLQCFSDTIVMYSPFKDEEGQRIIGPLLAMCGAAGATLCAALSRELAYRGAIEIGVGTEYWKGEVYGPVLCDVHSLEKDAEYPRIVIGPRASQSLRDAAEDNQSSDIARLNRGLAQFACSIIRADDDDKPVVDYLGKAFRDWFGADRKDLATAQRAWRFIDAEWERFTREGSHKLADRYARLRKYYEAGIAQWVEE